MLLFLFAIYVQCVIVDECMCMRQRMELSLDVRDISAIYYYYYYYC